MTYVDPYDNFNPPTVTESFVKLTSSGILGADRAFIVLATVAANNSPSTLDGEHMAKIRELVAVYTGYVNGSAASVNK